MSGAVLLGRMALSLLVVLVLMGGLAQVARRRGGLGLGKMGTGGRTQRLQVLSRHSVAKSASLAVVRVGGRDLLIGVTPSTISLLVEAEEGGLTEAAEAAGHGVVQGSTAFKAQFPSSSPWTVMLDQLRERTVRRV